MPDEQKTPRSSPVRGRRGAAPRTSAIDKTARRATIKTDSDEPVQVESFVPAARADASPEAPPAARSRRTGQRPPTSEPEAAGASEATGIPSDVAPATPKGRSGRRGKTAHTEPPVVAPVETSGPDLEFGVADASAEDLRAIARATGAIGANVAPRRSDESPARAFGDDEEMVTWSPSPRVAPAGVEDDVAPGSDELSETGEESGGVRRRRRRGRGRRGRGGQSGTAIDGVSENGGAATQPETAAAPSQFTPDRQLVVPRQPILPDYPVEFEPMPPPTKRRPARRPGMITDPRFSREEQAEIDQFVRTSPPAAAPVVSGTDEFRAALLTADEKRELEQAAPRPRSRRGRGSGRAAALPSPPETEPGLQATPAFAPMPVAPAARAGQNPLEALIARQNVILDTLMERQISLLRNIERSMIALDQRLGNGGQAAAKAARVGVFVDVPNVIYAAERIGCTIDFGKLLAILTRGRDLVRASAYSPVSDDPQMRVETQKFVQPFLGRGFRVVTKPLKRFADGTMKGNFDVELAMDVLTMADRLDVVCLVSGDGDFSRLVEMIAVKGVRVEVIAFSSSTSSELRAACDEYIDLGTRLREICF